MCILGIKSHSGYSSCTKCLIKGFYIAHKVCFPEVQEGQRNDDDFKSRKDKDHHIKSNIALENVSIGCVTQFPIDYMHCVCLGVMRQMLNLFIKHRKRPYSLQKKCN